MASCATNGGCPTDYIAVAISILSLILLIACAIFPLFIQKSPKPKTNGFWLVIVQIIGSFNLLLSLVMSVDFLRWNKQHFWQSCYIWAVWVEGPFGFGLLISCRIVQAFQLYYFFVRRRLPPVPASILLPVILIPWIGGAAFIHIYKPLNHRCHMRSQWVIPVVCVHALYLAALISVTMAVRHIEFRFREFKDLLRGIIASTVVIGLWSAAYVLNEVHEDILWAQVASRFLLLVMASLLVLAFFSMSISQPLLSQISLRKRESLKFATMGQFLGVSHRGIHIKTGTATVLDLSQPLDKLLADQRFLQSFMTFADSYVAGESVHFYSEVQELGKIPFSDPTRRVYMARHIIENYIVAGAEMEVNISYRSRQEILGTFDLAHPDLFNHAITEVMQLMNMNLAKNYWPSIQFVRLKEELQKQTSSHDRMEHAGWDFSSTRSCDHSAMDDPFHQEQLNRCASALESHLLSVEAK